MASIERSSTAKNILVYFLAIFYAVTMATLFVTTAGIDYSSVYLYLLSAVLLLIGSAVFCVVFIFLPPILPLLKQKQILLCKHG